MDKKKEFNLLLPDTFYLDINNKFGLNDYLIKQGVLSCGESITQLTIAGEGNMNTVLRGKSTLQSSYIIKQSRPWVEKYPQLEAPIERINIEATYLRLTSGIAEIKAYNPSVLLHDPENYIIVMEDLGDVSDYSYLYDGREQINALTLDSLCTYLEKKQKIQVDDYPDNMGLRLLNHVHIFSIPFLDDNGLYLDELQEGLQELADDVKSIFGLKEKIDEMGREYLHKGDVLLHGDFYPGSFLKSNKGVKVIDAEFSFLGFAEFDWAVLYGHLHLAKQSESTIEKVTHRVNESKDLDIAKVKAYAGIEVLRRIYGVAQLPLNMSLDEKKALTEEAMIWILEYDLD